MAPPKTITGPTMTIVALGLALGTITVARSQNAAQDPGDRIRQQRFTVQGAVDPETGNQPAALIAGRMVPDWGWVKMDDRRARWVQVFARLKPGYTAKSAEVPLQGLFLQIRQYEMTLAAAKDWSEYGRTQFMVAHVRRILEQEGYDFELNLDQTGGVAYAEVHFRTLTKKNAASNPGQNNATP